MKKWAAFLFICYLATNFPQTNISPQFSELKGVEDQQGNTHLFYRIYHKIVYSPYEDEYSNHIFHYDLINQIDTLFLEEKGYCNPQQSYDIRIMEIDFWNNNPAEYVYCGGYQYIAGPLFDSEAFVKRFDGYINWFGGSPASCRANYVDISKSNDSLLFLGWVENPYNWSTYNSVNGGNSWNSVVDSLQFLSLNPFNDDKFFLENDYGFLYRSTDAGTTFNLVDILNQPSHSTSFIYDPNQLHIYRLFGNQTLRISPNNGEPFSWENKYSSDTEIYISNDESVSGTIYLADKKDILVSTNYGDNFNLYKTLERNIVGIYKKPNSNKLYAATKYKIYEITPDTIQIIKSLPIPNEVLNFYPLSINFVLSQNYPNPFNPTTKIKYSIQQTSNVIIKVFDILGNEIEILVDEEKPAGIYEITWYAEIIPSGIYFYQLTAGNFIQTKKMILLK
jgi:hypothetical protein